MFTAFFARLFIKEPIVPADILNVILVFAGIVFVVKPPFIFGSTELYTTDPEAPYAVIILVLSTIFLQANCYVTLRWLKGNLHMD